MSDSVKFIFMTLIKVPVIIFVAFFILNIFAFFFIYFKILGLSYVTMQEVVENNYITSSQRNQLVAYFDTINAIPMASNTKLIVGKTGSGDVALYDASSGYIVTPSGAQATVSGTSALKRTQYGISKTVGVYCDYILVWPLSYANSLSSDGKSGTGVSGGALTVNGYNDSTSSTGSTSTSATQIVETTYVNSSDPYADDDDISGDRKLEVVIPFKIYYTVPGLKYYADL